MEVDYYIIVQPTNIEFQESWDSILSRYFSDEGYSFEQYIEDTYLLHKKEIAKKLAKQLIIKSIYGVS